MAGRSRIMTRPRPAGPFVPGDRGLDLRASRADDGSRTRDLELGKLALYSAELRPPDGRIRPPEQSNVLQEPRITPREGPSMMASQSVSNLARAVAWRAWRCLPRPPPPSLSAPRPASPRSRARSCARSAAPRCRWRPRLPGTGAARVHRRWIERCQSEDEIKAALVAEFGEGVLATPGRRRLRPGRIHPSRDRVAGAAASPSPRFAGAPRPRRCCRRRRRAATWPRVVRRLQAAGGRPRALRPVGTARHGPAQGSDSTPIQDGRAKPARWWPYICSGADTPSRSSEPAMTARPRSVRAAGSPRRPPPAAPTTRQSR